MRYPCTLARLRPPPPDASDATRDRYWCCVLRTREWQCMLRRAWMRRSTARSHTSLPSSATTPKAATIAYRGTSLTRKRTPLGPCSRPVPEGVLGGWAFSYERGAPVFGARGRKGSTRTWPSRTIRGGREMIGAPETLRGGRGLRTCVPHKSCTLHTLFSKATLRITPCPPAAPVSLHASA